MYKWLTMQLAVRLCSADISCGYISVEPVLGNRDELIEQRLLWYIDKIEDLFTKGLEIDEISIDILTKAVDLTCADIICDAISIAPILYDRNDKIAERILCYFNTLKSLNIHCGVLEDNITANELPTKKESDLRRVTFLQNKKKKNR